MWTSRKEAEVSLLHGIRATFYTRKKRMSAVEENPVGDSESNDVLVPNKSGHFNMQNFFGFKPDGDAQGEIINK